MSEMPTTEVDGGLDPNECYADPTLDYLAHEHPRNADDELELEAAGNEVTREAVERDTARRGPPLPGDQTTMGPADGIPYVPGERGEDPHDPFGDEEREKWRREADGEGEGDGETIVGD